MLPHLSAVVGQFRTGGTCLAAVPHGTGHIHDTFRVPNARPGGPDYLLQRINHRVFARVPELMDNIRRVTEHLRHHAGRLTLTLVPTREGKNYYQDDGGSYWRMYLFIAGARSYDLAQTTGQAYQGGRAFGQFGAWLADLPGAPLVETIPDFHNVETRLGAFREVLKTDPLGRAGEVAREIDFVEARAAEMPTLLRLGRAGTIPLRTTHNDTKFNNVLLDAEGQARCVVDLDTVMPGYVGYDFGDSIRTLVNTAAEDEADLGKIGLHLPFFEAYARGFLEETAHFLTPAERNTLAFGCRLLPFLMGLRFLTDHLGGDLYYKIHFEGHNRQRARAQFRLLECLEAQYSTLQILLDQAAGKS
ncbi:MAG: aminoglycoside phosphotransferase family protein [Ferruginibacter sp.]|nr:aminoglycoside phosphotransferase family protein [Cytophagales bacterium]